MMKNYKGLTRRAKIRLFQTYMRSKINHLIPLIAITGDVNQMWKMIRKTIFYDIMGEATIPKESFAAFGMSFYDIIVRPTLKMIQRSERVTADDEESEMLKEASKKIFKVWLSGEQNHTLSIRKEITEIIEDRKWLTVEEWDKLLRQSMVIGYLRVD